jgi:hypothetical protein
MIQENIRELSREVDNAGDFMRSPEADTTYETEAAMVEANMESRMRFQKMETRLAEEKDKLQAIEDELAQMQRELMK